MNSIIIFFQDYLRYDDNGHYVMTPSLQLKYSTHKNLAIIASNNEQYDTAMKHYVEVSCH